MAPLWASQQHPGVSVWVDHSAAWGTDNEEIWNEIGTRSPKVKGTLQKGSETLESNFSPSYTQNCHTKKISLWSVTD